MNAEKVLFSVLIGILTIVAIVTSLLIISIGINSGTFGMVAGFVVAAILLYATYKVCGFFCKRIFKSGKA